MGLRAASRGEGVNAPKAEGPLQEGRWGVRNDLSRAVTLLAGAFTAQE